MSVVSLLLDKLKVEGLREHGGDHFEDHLGKGFTEADPLTAIEWEVAHR